MRLLRFICLSTAAIGGHAALADQFAERRNMCTPLMTIVKEDCQIENFYRCDGNQTYFEVYPLDTNPRFHLVDENYRHIFSVEAGTNRDLNGWREIRDPFLMDKLLETGFERSEQLMNVSMFPGVEQLSWTVSTYELSDEVMSWDSQSFSVIDVVEVGEVGYGGNIAKIGTTYVYHAETGVMTDQRRSFSLNGSTLEIPVSVERVIVEGSPGFMSAEPDTFCKEQLSMLSQHVNSYMENAHDHL